ncbi:MAG TPA: ABC transporter permease subunit [Dongiaceae bacterium]|nr:ABC transporter permease subunit [Dongiaceae bacterium]
MDISQCYAFLHTEPGPHFDLCFMLLTVMPALIKAIPLSLFLLITSGVIGNLLAVPVAVARVSHNPALWMPSYIFILLMRGTPLLIQIYLIYYGLGQVLGDMHLFGKPLMRALPFLREGIYYAIFALSINTAGYTGEILRGAVLAVPHGEIEAGKAFGMSPWLIFRRITLPRAIRICLPAMSTETILLLKATALASTITVYEVLGTAQFIRSQTYRIYETLISAGIVYIVLVFILTRILNALERYLNKDRERPVSIPLAQTVKP